MKFAKLTLALLLAASISFVGCLGDDDNPAASSGSIVGKWLLTDVTIDGTKMEEIYPYYLVFEEDSTGQRLDMDNNLLHDFTWNVDSDKLTFNYHEGGSEIRDFSVTSTKLIIEMVYVMEDYTEHFIETFTRQ
ncbi:lipocalin family protein [bacterium]|nr:lipocalin family protein [bacterium]